MRPEDGDSASRAPEIAHAVGPLGSHPGNPVMISGECRVEPIGLSTGHQLALEGLRLRLDLRIVPGTAEDGSAAAIWRVEDGRVRTLPLGVPAVYRRAAVLSGLGVLAVAIGIWLAGSRAPSDGVTASPIITTTVAPAAEGGTSGGASAGPHSPSVAVLGGDVSPNVAPLSPALSAPAATVPAAAPPASAAPPDEPAAATGQAPLPSASHAPEERVVAPRPRPAPGRAPAGDMLDLFSDPK